MTLQLNNQQNNNVRLDYVDQAQNGRNSVITFPQTDGTVAIAGTAGGLAGNLASASIFRLEAAFTNNNVAITGWQVPNETGETGGFPANDLVDVNANGVFTFPEAGIWIVIMNANFSVNNATVSTGVLTQFTSNNGGAWANRAIAATGASGNANVVSTTTSFCFFDIGNTDNDKVRFASSNFANDTQINGTVDQNQTTAVFLRIGDT